MEALGRQPNLKVIGYDLGSPADVLEQGLRTADVIYHLAGVNRPKDPGEFAAGNAGFTGEICSRLQAVGRKPVVVMTSSIQAVLDNPYGVSKFHAEEALQAWARESDGTAIVFRLKNVFGKWCRPNYNSVTATFCHNIAHDLPITISDPARELELVYIDDVVEALIGCLSVESGSGFGQREVARSYHVTLGQLAEHIRSFKATRTTLIAPRSDDEFARRLYATYLSYLDGPDFAYALQQRTDPRGTLAEFIKSPAFGQIFVSRTKPGITRGNHYHHSKVEKFLVLEGEAVIRFRAIQPEVSSRNAVSAPITDNRPPIIEHRVNGREFRVVDIPPGYTHSIENVGSGELVTLFWANEIFDPERPDTFMLPVIPTGQGEHSTINIKR